VRDARARGHDFVGEFRGCRDQDFDPPDRTDDRNSLANQKKSLLDRERRFDRERQRWKSLGQMAGGVVREFDYLLQPIMGMTELAIEDTGPASELAEQLGISWSARTRGPGSPGAY
jgi:hypothetical protein